MCCRTSIPLIVTCMTLAIVSAGTAEGQSCPQITDPQPLNTNAAFDGGADSFPEVTTDGQGNWVAVWHSNDDLGGTIGTDTDILFALSTDNGAMWTDPAPLNTNAASDSDDDTRAQVTTDGQGNWVAVWDSRDDLGGTIGTDGDILHSFSSNNGATWTDPEPLNTNAAGDSGSDRAPQVTTDGAGNWVAVWYSWDDLGGTIGTDGDILFARSADNGVTWTDPAPLNTSAASDCQLDVDDYPQVTTDGVGTWLAVWHSETYAPPPGEDGCKSGGPDGDIFFARSFDNGATWSDPALLNSNGETDYHPFVDTAPQVTTDGEGNWVALWQSTSNLDYTIGADWDILFALSSDDGATWTDAAPLNSNAAFDGNFSFDRTPELTTDGSGNWVAAWHFIEDIWKEDEDYDVYFARSTDNGSSWSARRALNTNAASDEGSDARPQLSTDGAGNWVGVWNSSDDLGGTVGTDRDILLTRFQLLPGDCPCLPDLDGDGAVGAGDLAALLGAWGPNPDHPADFNGDGVVDAFDLAYLLGNWGPCP